MFSCDLPLSLNPGHNPTHLEKLPGCASLWLRDVVMNDGILSQLWLSVGQGIDMAIKHRDLGSRYSIYVIVIITREFQEDIRYCGRRKKM